MQQITKQMFGLRSSTYLPIVQFAKAKKTEQEIKSVEVSKGHKPPVYEDSVHGKYAGVLFTSASKSQSLFQVLKDMQYFKELANGNEAFRNFLGNAAFSRGQQKEVFGSFGKDQINPLTVNFLNTLIENGRTSYLLKIADKFIDYYRILNKEENITIISAKELSTEERYIFQDLNDKLHRNRVIGSLKQQNPSITFTVQFQVDPTILGGLQMYSGNKFLDCSLLSRVQKIKGELQKVSF